MQVHHDETGQRVLSVSARNRPEEYEVYYRVEYSVSLAGEEIVPRQELQLTANYSYDSRLALAKQHEQAELQMALARELAAVILRRLDALRREANRTAHVKS
jgi:outer membrane lipopolysaccharide assembly protein LptE/RlpB